MLKSVAFFFFFNYSKRKPSCSGRLTCTLLSLWFKRTFSGVRSLHHGSLLLLQGFLAEVEPGKLLENENGNMMNLTEGCPLSSHFKASSHTAQSGTLVLCLFDLSFRHVQSIYVQTYVLWTWIRRLWQDQETVTVSGWQSSHSLPSSAAPPPLRLLGFRYWWLYEERVLPLKIDSKLLWGLLNNTM